MSKNAFEPGDRLLNATLAQMDRAGHHNEVVDDAGVARERGRHAGLDQALCIGFTLVTQGVVLGADHQRGRQATQVGGAQRAGAEVVVITRAALVTPVTLAPGATP